MKKNKIRINRSIILNVFFVALLVATGVYDIKSFYGPVTGVDDIGYWSCAYFFSEGYVKPIVSGSYYYAYGYGLLLSPFVHFIKDAQFLYWVIIFINTMLNVGSYFLLILIGNIMNLSGNKYLHSIMAYISVSYLSLYVYSKFIFTECLLTFLFLLEVFLIIRLFNKFSVTRMCECGIVIVYLYNVHQRTLSVVIAFCVVLLMYIFIKKDKEAAIYFIFGVIIILLFFFVGVNIKHLIKDQLYMSQSMADGNDYSANVGKLALLFNLKNLFYVILSFLEKIFYFNFSTLLVGTLGLLSCINYIIKCVKTKKADRNFFIEFFLVLSWVLSICVASVFAFGPLIDRFEFAVYGRYIEYIFPLYIFIGLSLFEKKFNELKYSYIVGIVFLILGFCAIKYQFDSSGVKYSISWLSPATYYFFSFKENLSIGMKMIAKVSILGCIILYVVIKYKKKFAYILLVTCLLITWGINGIKLEKRVIASNNYLYSQCHGVIEKINELKKDIYFFDIKNNRAQEMQFMCNSVNFYKLTLKDIVKLSDINVLINSEDIQLLDSLHIKCKIIYSDDDWKMVHIDK